MFIEDLKRQAHDTKSVLNVSLGVSLRGNMNLNKLSRASKIRLALSNSICHSIGKTKGYAMNVEPHNPDYIKKLKQLAAIQKNAKQRDKYRAVAMALEGRTISHIMYVLSRSKNFVQRWTYFYRDGGIDAIVPTPQKGRPTILPAKEEQLFKQRILAGPTSEDNGICTLRGKDAMRILQKEFGVKYTLNAVYALMHRLGLSCLTPRPRHRHNDPAAMEQWLNDAPPFCPNNPKRKSRQKNRNMVSG
ncbi:MAG: hypothetical protein A2Y12_05615 [Planctomycetes bacterium GWF2_42_9]|nr:MAG: hypothetical protein A2Y12_05615 [Planctomycetes bacterium GWF2_42_9]